VPNAHAQHLETIDAKLRARGLDTDEAVAAIVAGQLDDAADPALIGLRGIVAALGSKRTRELLEQLRSGG